VVVATARGLEPVNAIGAIDERLDGWIALAVKRGMIGGCTASCSTCRRAVASPRTR